MAPVYWPLINREIRMNFLAFIGILTLVCGTAAATVADRYPERRLALQRLAGVLVIAGVALLGLAFPAIV